MKSPRQFFAILAAAALAPCLVLGGCKSATQQAANQQPGSQQAGNPSAQSAPNSQQPAASQPSGPSSGAQPAPSAAQPAPAAAPAPPPPPATIDLPVGTTLSVRLDQDLGSKISQPGDSFSATVAEDVLVDGQVVIPRESRADGTVIDAKPLGHFKGGALLEVRLERVHTRWGSYPVATASIDRVEKGKGKRSTAFIGGGAGLGAIVGGIAGGGKGALIGALAGGGAGTAGSALTGNKQIFLPAETLLSFRLEHPVHITEQK